MTSGIKSTRALGGYPANNGGDRCLSLVGHHLAAGQPCASTPLCSTRVPIVLRANSPADDSVLNDNPASAPVLIDGIDVIPFESGDLEPTQVGAKDTDEKCDERAIPGDRVGT